MQKNDVNYFLQAPISPDRELLLWEKWVQIRSEEVASLAKKLDRPPVDLTMNQLDKVREDKERKTALEHAQIEKKSGIRGSLWERPLRLKQRCYCSPAYEVQRTQAEKGRPPVLEHIGVPAYIRQTEMGMYGETLRDPCLKLNAEYEMYRDLREDQLIERINKIDPYWPDIDALMVKGKRPATPPPKIPPLPEISVEFAEDLREEQATGVYALEINKNVFFKDVTGPTRIKFQELDTEGRCISWTYYFNVPVKRAGRCKMFIQNLGTVTLRYCWKIVNRSLPFVPEELHEQVFFFNKNEDVICPGQSKEIFFTFIADKPAIYYEFWEFCVLNVSFFESNAEKFVVKLYGHAVINIEALNRKSANLKYKIYRKTLNNLASEFLEEIIDKVFEVVPQIYPYKHFFVEAEMFVLKNPVCFYHQTEVAKLKDMYTEMAPGQEWDLSIATWRRMMMSKEFDDRMKYYELLRKCHAECLKPWYEGDGLILEKRRTVKHLLEQFVDLFDSEYVRITDIFLEKSPASKFSLQSKSKSAIVVVDPKTAHIVRSLFYVHIYEHFANTIELCAGVLSSLDLNKWIEFDFCRHYD